MSDAADPAADGESVEAVDDAPLPDAPEDLLAATPEAAYLWGRVAADGSIAGDEVSVRVGDAEAAERVAALFGERDVDRAREVTEREYAHNTDVTRTSDEFVVAAQTPAARRAAAAFGLPADGDESGGYRFSALDDHRRQLLRGLVEGCGTVCYKSDANAVGISVVHDDEALLATVRAHLDAAPVDASYGDLNESSSGGYWFGVADDAGPALGEWLYEGSTESGLFAPQRRRKTRRSIERVRGDGTDADGGEP
ncbi:cobalamin biosynthesis protein [Halobaculum sp. CBA1158]|uniref:cobalamin biosynthesis protein n=1 Tax=Halobaculum sp. CBA1158 TaxID=2904243 RepID=UPI001F36327F|nr:cobalamin biosynthesis protein [Halobaculum sp. CBA1158]UIO99840.1 cobalamin biosynthesis protein [Halobaculum sp. CBA1158]